MKNFEFRQRPQQPLHFEMEWLLMAHELGPLAARKVEAKPSFCSPGAQSRNSIWLQLFGTLGPLAARKGLKEFLAACGVHEPSSSADTRVSAPDEGADEGADGSRHTEIQRSEIRLRKVEEH